MPTYLTNEEAEELLLEIRTARNAARQEIGAPPGAFLVFPTSVVVGAPRVGGQAVYPLAADVEPGSVVTSRGSVQVAATVAGIAVSGSFHWELGDERPTPAAYQFRHHGRAIPAPPWACQLPRSRLLPVDGRPELARRRRRILRQGRAAEDRLLTLSDGLLRAACCGSFQRVMKYRPHLDVDDLVQRGLQAACRLLPLYASPRRPPCSWVAMLRLDARRDMHREVARRDGFSEDAAAAVTLAALGDVRPHTDPAATSAALVAAAQRLGRPAPRITASCLDAALRAPALLAHAQADAALATEPGPEAQAFQRARCGQGMHVVATVARLITDDPRLIAAAAEGDPQALKRVGDRVVSRLRGDQESRPAARHRCWEEFRTTGQLFGTPAGRRRFSAAADPVHLAVLDDHLRRSAGVAPVAASR